MNLFALDKECCGCGACESACPQGIIEMKKNEEGFLYPKITELDKCINCKKCQRVCPMKTELKEHEVKCVLAGVSNDEYIWNSSSSGGVFSEICRVCDDQNTIFVGARWNGIDVVYDCTNNIAEQEKFRKSKYVSANPNGVLRKIKDYLNNGKKIVFSGTPCQNQALVNFLGNRYRDKMILIDFACHGQGSPAVFQKWVSFLEKKYNKKVERFDFRAKEVIEDHVNSNCCKYTFDDGSSVVTHRDYYHHAFVNGLCMRKSCVNCKFASARQSDITLADFKNLKNGLTEYDSKKNVSTVICNTEKGKEVVSSLANIRWMKCDSDFVIKYNPKLIRGMAGNPNRDAFMREVLSEKPILGTIKKYARITPSEWASFNCSEKFCHKYYKLLRLLDILVWKLTRIWKK